MTYFVAYGLVVFQLRETIFNPTYRIVKPRSIQVKELEDFPSKIPNDYEEFNFLTVEDGNAIYTKDTKILQSLLYPMDKQRGNPVRYNIDIEDISLRVLMGYEKGFRNLWKEMSNKDESYKSQGMAEMFKVISSEIANAIKD